MFWRSVVLVVLVGFTFFWCICFTVFSGVYSRLEWQTSHGGYGFAPRGGIPYSSCVYTLLVVRIRLTSRRDTPFMMERYTLRGACPAAVGAGIKKECHAGRVSLSV